MRPGEVIRATSEEKEVQIETLAQLKERNAKEIEEKLQTLKDAAVQNGNTFEALMEATKYCSLGQITRALYEVGGQYRRNM